MDAGSQGLEPPSAAFPGRTQGAGSEMEQLQLLSSAPVGCCCCNWTISLLMTLYCPRFCCEQNLLLTHPGRQQVMTPGHRSALTQETQMESGSSAGPAWPPSVAGIWGIRQQDSLLAVPLPSDKSYISSPSNSRLSYVSFWFSEIK